MKKILSSFIAKTTFIFCLNFQLISAMETQYPTYELNPYNRPEYLNENINRAYDGISKMNVVQHDWVTFGAYQYNILSPWGDNPTIDGFLKSLIDQDQTEINILDVGAGNFAWGRCLATRVNEFLLNKDKTHVNIISLTGESHDGEEITQKGKCTLYEFGRFKIENLNTKLEKKGLTLNNKTHLIVSSWTFIHLNDPLGVLQMLINFLEKNTGIIVNQWADVNLKYESQSSGEEIVIFDKSFFYFYTSLVDSDIDLLMFPGRGSNKGYVIKKKTDANISLPFAYDPTVQNIRELDSSRIEPHPFYLISEEIVNKAKASKYSGFVFYGCQTLFDELLGYNKDFSKGVCRLPNITDQLI